MRPEIAVLDIQGQYRVYTEFHRAEGAEKTIILINGSLATTASFAQTVRSLHPQFNVVLYDQPYAGKSKPHNRQERLITKETESHILLELIEHFQADHVMSFSWGGACALLALAHQPRLVKKAIVSSFSPVINEPMRDYLERGCQFLAACDRYQVGNLVNDTIGKYLPSLFKRFNYRHVSSLDSHEYAQMHFHINQVLDHDLERALKAARNIDIPVLFINGDRDEYTTVEDARQFSRHVGQSHFSVIHGAGHFLDMEHKSACEDTRSVMLGFLKPTVRESRQRYTHTQGQHALAI
ncbi:MULTISPECIES: alpha/beta fold hydrolase [Pseudomonas]|uniref:Alpha/beta hydrolase n=2 Tax=Pseudomonas TaxID=286 RepID=A0ABM7CMB5_9PSED|nr:MULTISPECIES: alpha/beta hydrolase [Pseudomonas]AZL67231.1 alpha/beta hydrolase [Pseudomonas oryziphila]AZL72538.1 alpha/beta hydrolase [Pseudomonas oryziphila]MDZ4018208.1 3-(3-hydroxydecanoyloxy)decanoate synthase [Pseudomonas sichuanensis]UVK84123.1 alpha/beta hydrolase [Pseudomonas sichuanensis]UVL90336.1 alpha/beta hydrolase [Pseudomonas sichuanensis]